MCYRFSGIAFRVITAGLMEWQRKSELSGDRAGLDDLRAADHAFQRALAIRPDYDSAKRNLALVRQEIRMAAAVLRDDPLPVTGEEGRMTVAVMQAAQESGDAGGQIIDCIRVLEGYWPQFLLKHVPLAPAPPSEVAQTPRRPADAEAPQEEPSGLLKRIRGMVPERLRF